MMSDSNDGKQSNNHSELCPFSDRLTASFVEYVEKSPKTTRDEEYVKFLFELIAQSKDDYLNYTEEAIFDEDDLVVYRIQFYIEDIFCFLYPNIELDENEYKKMAKEIGISTLKDIDNKIMEALSENAIKYGIEAGIFIEDESGVVNLTPNYKQ